MMARMRSRANRYEVTNQETIGCKLEVCLNNNGSPLELESLLFLPSGREFLLSLAFGDGCCKRPLMEKARSGKITKKKRVLTRRSSFIATPLGFEANLTLSCAVLFLLQSIKRIKF
jgi:hypothetical protein